MVSTVPHHPKVNDWEALEKSLRKGDDSTLCLKIGGIHGSSLELGTLLKDCQCFENVGFWSSLYGPKLQTWSSIIWHLKATCKRIITCARCFTWFFVQYTNQTHQDSAGIGICHPWSHLSSLGLTVPVSQTWGTEGWWFSKSDVHPGPSPVLPREDGIWKDLHSQEKCPPHCVGRTPPTAAWPWGSLFPCLGVGFFTCPVGEEVDLKCCFKF